MISLRCVSHKPSIAPHSLNSPSRVPQPSRQALLVPTRVAPLSSLLPFRVKRVIRTWPSSTHYLPRSSSSSTPTMQRSRQTPSTSRPPNHSRQRSQNSKRRAPPSTRSSSITSSPLPTRHSGCPRRAQARSAALFSFRTRCGVCGISTRHLPDVRSAPRTSLSCRSQGSPMRFARPRGFHRPVRWWRDGLEEHIQCERSELPKLL